MKRYYNGCNYHSFSAKTCSKKSFKKYEKEAGTKFVLLSVFS